MDGKSTHQPKYIIREASIPDIERIVDLAQEGSLEVEIYGFSRSHVYLVIKDIIKNGVGRVLLHEGDIVGYVGGVLTKHPYDPSIKVLITKSWYVSPPHRTIESIKLVKEYIKEAKKCGVNTVRMQSRVAKDPVSMTKLYERLGFTTTEIAYEMELN